MLPVLPLQPVSTAGVVQELVVEKSNIPTLLWKRLYNMYHMTSLRRLDLTGCGMQSIEDNSFFDMALLQHLNLRYSTYSEYLIVSLLPLT